MRFVAFASCFALFLGCGSSGETPAELAGASGSAGAAAIDASPGGGSGTGGASGAGASGGEGGSGGGEAGSSGTGAGGGTPDGGSGTDAGADATDPGDAGSMPAPRQLSLGPAVLAGVTADSHAVYRNAVGTLLAISLAPEASPLSITETPGTLLISGRVVFSWADIDWTTNLGILRIWTANGGTLEIGAALYAEDMVAASADGMIVAYNVNVAQTTTDLMLARTDFFAPVGLITGLGRGSADTCRASFGFVGARLFAGWCRPGSQVAVLERYENGEAGWTPATIANNTLPRWSADRAGERVFYQSSDYRAHFAELGQSRQIDSSVSGGTMLPDGSGVLYNVGDQLRRTAVPEINPIPVVTRGFAQRAEFSPDYANVLYSRKLVYEGGTKRDLLLTDTHGFNPTPRELVAEPVASLSRSAFTADGKHVLYLTGSTLHALSIETGSVRRFEGVDTVVATRGSRIVFSDNRSDPQVYPIVADLKTVDLAAAHEPQLIEAKIADGRSFYLSPEKDAVLYVRSGADRDRADPASSGVFVRALP